MKSRSLIVLACGLALSLPACDGGSATSTGASPTGSSQAGLSLLPMPDAALCAQVAALRASLDALTNVTIAPGVAAELSADLGAVKANLAQFTAAARGHAQAQTDALQSTLTKLATAIRDLAASPSTDTANAVRAALGEVKAAGQELVAAVTRECPSASPTPSR